METTSASAARAADKDGGLIALLWRRGGVAAQSILNRRLERSFSGPRSFIKLFFQLRIDASQTS
jgi:hypothetical protein